MKLKTEDEVYEISMNRSHAICPISFAKGYTQAQQDLLASASEGFDELKKENEKLKADFQKIFYAQGNLTLEEIEDIEVKWFFKGEVK